MKSSDSSNMSRTNVGQREPGRADAPFNDTRLGLPFSHQVSWQFRLRAVYIQSVTAQSDAEYLGDNSILRRSCPNCQLGIGGIARSLFGKAPFRMARTQTRIFASSAGALLRRCAFGTQAQASKRRHNDPIRQVDVADLDGI
jgi:hypothetical protein